jgi:hypothetical protein
MAASTTNPLCTPHLPTDSPTSAVDPAPTSAARYSPLQAPDEHLSPALPHLEKPASPTQRPRRLPPLQGPSVASSADPPTAPVSLPPDNAHAPHDASLPLPNLPKPSPADPPFLDEPLPLPPPQPVDEDPTLLHHYLSLPDILMQPLSHPMVHRVDSYLWVTASVLSTAPLFLAAPGPPRRLPRSWRWLLLMLRRMLFIYPELLVIQLCQFETWLLLGNGTHHRP